MVHLPRLLIASLCGHAVLGNNMPFDAREATIDSVHHALYSGLSTCREVISSFIANIEANNKRTNAIISLNPNALAIADEKEEQLSAGNATGSLFCIPILLKDNYDTKDLPTTGGNLALARSQPTEDAPSVAAFKNAGAIILGKANLHELALEGISVSSLGGQTINPYDSTRTPGGSSGGTGAAVAASFCVFGTGTDTVNSLRSPASANSLCSIRPTRGLITRAGIIPISKTHDVIGPIGRTVKDVATALTVMASTGYDAADNDTALVPGPIRGIDYASSLSSASLKGLRIGVLSGFFNRTDTPEVTPVNNAMDSVMSRLSAEGVTLVPINETIYNATAIQAAYDVQRFEYRQLMDQYLERPSLGGEHPTTLAELYSRKAVNGSGGEFLVIPSQYEYVNTALVSSTANATYLDRQAGIRNLTLALLNTFTANSLDAIIYPEQKNLVVKIGSPSQSGRNGILAALTGTPVVTVPAGFSEPSDEAPAGVPIGMEILGRPWEEQKLLGVGYAVEQLLRVRKSPVWVKEAVEVRAYDRVPVITPDRGNIPSDYPLGTL
ncbi:GatA Asp-tRNAAsn Glu-tRNAGln amidotransferase A subunit [Pyrenophora tritici-repentis]|nr:GatA Asp-tRNAAsn-Glu-tRNAGln amidotransferase A subunit and related amidase [Pyrenophora tritici-repentis]KAF7450973.1 GatA Asp-tRNAAsn-Glu-tRNAGln amidotransferase A protein [Pyrenophora tritici-repentis]KAI0573263.1 GatA Asp-tRNAAsn-Glu-tRNAGln amidotransferase A subunit and related amidase [Pyrenophora tritici-repentis]KAI0577086.1 GatA Asp-tRNAAsn-Glu-tRNAGln amidotransferase A subunit and related amidase [Pyrenophora tritici-repentis]KAI0619312.1 GatA Asp-tRNAAsn-Glu-tRNAGln amidotransf